VCKKFVKIAKEASMDEKATGTMRKAHGRDGS
jgi:hypothetical protein